jgi:hypothetical protein
MLRQEVRGAGIEPVESAGHSATFQVRTSSRFRSSLGPIASIRLHPLALLALATICAVSMVR